MMARVRHTLAGFVVGAVVCTVGLCVGLFL